VVIGNAFHWMDRARTLRTLDRLVRPGGAVVLLESARDPELAPPEWLEALVDTLLDWTDVAAPGTEPGTGSTAADNGADHEEVLRTSAFSALRRAEFVRDVELDLDAVVGLQFSTLYAAPARWGERREAFERDLRAALREANPRGPFTDRTRTVLTLATRPGEAPA
jgi:SAM-dependent methyltransferase